MPSFEIRLPGGASTYVEATQFYHDICSRRFSFYVHDAHDDPTTLCVSHKSGNLVTTVAPFRLQYTKGDRVLAARNALTEYAVTHGDKLVAALLQLEDIITRRPV
jgi:hypothetical protein